MENLVEVDAMLTDNAPINPTTQKPLQKTTEKSVRAWLKEETTLTKEQIEQVMKYKIVS